jgi:hypothetical protein
MALNGVGNQDPTVAATESSKYVVEAPPTIRSHTERQRVRHSASQKPPCLITLLYTDYQPPRRHLFAHYHRQGRFARLVDFR